MPKTAVRPKKAAPKTASRAKVVLVLNGASSKIEESENVRFVTDVDSANLVVHFGTPFRDNLYRCDVIPSEPTDYEIKVRSENGVGIHMPAPWPSKVKIVCEAI